LGDSLERRTVSVIGLIEFRPRRARLPPYAPGRRQCYSALPPGFVSVLSTEKFPFHPRLVVHELTDHAVMFCSVAS
jgi:hypothetical protein